MLIIDPMHNLFLGTGKRMLNIWLESSLLSSSQFRQTQECFVLVSTVVLLPFFSLPFCIAHHFSINVYTNRLYYWKMSSIMFVVYSDVTFVCYFLTLDDSKFIDC